jgi:hypothetical protein
MSSLNPHTLLRSKPRPDQEGIPLNATPCQRPWVIAAQPHERPPGYGLRWFNHATFDGKLFWRSRVGWHEISRNQIRLLSEGHGEPRGRATLFLHESRGSPASVRRPSQGVSARKALVRTANVQGGNMDNTTLLIVLIVVIIVLGGGWYGRGRWY